MKLETREMIKCNPILKVAFYAESNGNEPVRKWLKSLDDEVRLFLVRISRRFNLDGLWDYLWSKI
jgi:hypothetical protein